MPWVLFDIKISKLHQSLNGNRTTHDAILIELGPHRASSSDLIVELYGTLFAVIQEPVSVGELFYAVPDAVVLVLPMRSKPRNITTTPMAAAGPASG